MKGKYASKDGPFTVSVKCDGEVVDCSAYIASIKVESCFNRIATAVVTLDDGGRYNEDFTIGDSNTFLPGRKISISAGYGDEYEIFAGIVVKNASSLSGNRSQLIVTAKHEAFKMTRTRRCKRYQDMTDGEIIEEISNSYGISADVDRTDIKHESMVQFNASDWDFINLRSEANGQILRTVPEGLVSSAPDLSSQAALIIENSLSIIDFEAVLDGGTAYDNGVVESWNYTTGEVEKETMPTGDFDTDQGDLSSSDIAKELSSGDINVVFDGMQTASEEMTSWLKAAMMRKNLARITGKVKIAGNSEITLADLVQFENLGSRFSGQTIVSGITHIFEENSWTTELSFGYEDKRFSEKFDNINQATASGTLPSVNGLQVAIVDQITEDPLGQNRIRLHLVNGEDTSIWARMALLDAGDSRGFHFMPEVGDEVIVGFVNDNPNLPVVLGMLHSGNRPAPVEAEEDNFVKGIYTREKIKLEFDDDKKSVLIETPGGNRISISDDAKGISLEDLNGNKITMNDQGISIESAKDITLKANASFKASGQSGAEVSTNATAVLKGSMVQIN